MNTLLTKDMTFNQRLYQLDFKVGLDEDSLNLFEWSIIEYYGTKIKEDMEFLANRPDLIHINKEGYLNELNTLMNYFITKEDFEKCNKIKLIKQELNYE